MSNSYLIVPNCSIIIILHSTQPLVNLSIENIFANCLYISHYVSVPISSLTKALFCLFIIIFYLFIAFVFYCYGFSLHYFYRNPKKLCRIKENLSGLLMVKLWRVYQKCDGQKIMVFVTKWRGTFCVKRFFYVFFLLEL